ncbi:MAG TPA: aldehyde dehydrogenase (NADP(+)) [Jiangellaceae bacterium]|nr:aldehyde dehydrogenase (NADP(+)) [Jiangellaceae bacterium]
MTDVDLLARAAAEAANGFEALGRTGRAALLDQAAEALESDRQGIVEIADRETRLGDTRLDGELTRTCYQLRLFGTVLREGSYLEATIDSPADTPMGPRPDLRRMLVPVGPVGVFGASNFPLAFSVPGGDTASALAAGCPVLVKAHPSHPETSRRTYDALNAVLPAGVLGLVEGYEAGVQLVQHQAVKAVGFTGSTAGGRALFDLAAARPEPIPFYGEMGSLNPLVVTPGAAGERPGEIAAGYIGSMTLGTGQFCTKPGLIFVPAGAARLRSALAEGVAALPAGPMLNDAIQEAFQAEVQRRRADTRLTLLGEGVAGDGDGVPALFAVTAGDLDGELLEECFGPSALLVEYTDLPDLLIALDRLNGQLTASVHTADGEDETVRELHEALRRRAGRLIFGGYPTGVAVAWAMHHGGPYPATTVSGHTSVGATSIRRWLRPISYQNAPASVLPEELRDGNPAGVPRRINGTLE